MKLLVSWLRELVDVPVPIPQLASDLHLAGFEVASVDPPPDHANADDDAVIDFEITSNRPDCLSVRGLAREVATRYGSALRSPAMKDLGQADPGHTGDLTVTIEAADGCARYCGALADVTVGPSPDWIRQRLAAAGIRAINNIVDITNYVLLEIGQPMHAFDFDKIGGRELRVRRSKPGERVKTLDGQERSLDEHVLVIADAERPQALAGVMGGADSEVSSTTRTIALESAWFEPTGIRRTSRRIGLSTEASYRFERGADMAAPPLGIARALALIEQTGAGRARAGWIDACVARRPPVMLSLRLDRIERTLGVEIGEDAVRRILSGLGFRVGNLEPGVLGVGIPSWRVDVSRDVDLVEEVARHFGYDRLPTTFPALAQAPAPTDPRLERDRQARRLAAAAGFSEAVTFSFIERSAALAFAAEGELVDILNPLSEQFAVLRPSLIPGLVDAIAHNRRRDQEDVRLFELGTVFRTSAGERRTIGFAWLGAADPHHWTARARSVDFFDLKGAVEFVASGLGGPADCSAADYPFLVRGRSAHVLSRTGGVVGLIGKIAPSITDARDIPAGSDLYVAELDLDALVDLTMADQAVTSVPPPRHPSVIRDLSIMVDDILPASTVRGTIRAAAPATLADVHEFDRYQGKGVPDGRVSLAYRLTFRAADRTLTDAEVQRAMDDILRTLVAEHRAVQR